MSCRLLNNARQALHFEQRKGVQNIGSGVRDAASYVLWSLGRAVSPDALRDRAPELATGLMTAALFDREVHIRRAASAAYQEIVGRLVRQLDHLRSSAANGTCRSAGHLPTRNRRAPYCRLPYGGAEAIRIPPCSTGRGQVSQGALPIWSIS